MKNDLSIPEGQADWHNRAQMCGQSYLCDVNSMCLVRDTGNSSETARQKYDLYVTSSAANVQPQIQIRNNNVIITFSGES